MTISLFWNKRPSIATPRYSMPSSGVFLCLDEVSTSVKMTGVDSTVNRKKAKYHKIVRHNLRGIIESLMYYAAFLIEGYCDHLPPLSERYWTFLILKTVKLLPIWTMLIDRIIDRIWFSAVTLSSELLNPTHFVAYCRVVVECDSLLTAPNSAIKRCPQCRHSYIIR